MGKRSERKSDQNLRIMLAQEAVRLICYHGLEDFRAAKQKAAENLGLHGFGALPNNLEVEAAVAERNRLFGADTHAQRLSQMRSAAARTMLELDAFAPRLVGSVLSGNVTATSAIKLHLFSDAAEEVGLYLESRNLGYSAIQQRIKITQESVEYFPGYRFYADEFKVEAIVFPERRRNNAPLSPLDGRPMQRAKLRDVERLAGGG